MARFRDMPVRRKLTLGLLVSGGSALVLACAAFVANDIVTFRRTLVRDLTILADVLGNNSTAALSFNVRETAEETLAALKAQPHIVTASLYDSHGRVFATYARPGETAEVPARAGDDGYRFERHRLVLFRKVMLEKQRVGTIYLQSDLDERDARLRLYGVVVAVVLASTVLLMVALSTHLQRSITAPIAALSHTARRITEGKDYSVRAQKHGQDELGLLTDAFNDMLAQIERREADLQKAHEELEVRVAERTAELARANEAVQSKAEELARSNADLEQFAYVASHDLQEPLRMVSSYLQLVERQLAGKLDADSKEYMGYALDGATRMRVLIKDLLEYSRVGRKGRPVVPVDCGQALETALGNLKPALEEHHARVTHGPLPTVAGDEGEMAQLFQNLVSNAIKFHGTQPPEIRIEAARRGAEWLFSVRDNGIGIDPKYAERIFVIFQRLHTRDKYPGTGIGLAVCKKIVEQQRGRIWVESAVGQGATFHFTLPAANAA